MTDALKEIVDANLAVRDQVMEYMYRESRGNIRWGIREVDILQGVKADKSATRKALAYLVDQAELGHDSGTYKLTAKGANVIETRKAPAQQIGDTTNNFYAAVGAVQQGNNNTAKIGQSDK